MLNQVGLCYLIPVWGLALLVDQHGVFDEVGGKTSTPAFHASRQVWIPMIFQPGVHWLVLVWCWWTSIVFSEKLYIFITLDYFVTISTTFHYAVHCRTVQIRSLQVEEQSNIVLHST